MKLFSYEMSDKSKKYDFYMTNAAMKEIQETQMKEVETIGETDVMKTFTKAQRLQTELSKAQTDEEKEAIQDKLDELHIQMLPHISEMSRLNDIDVEEIPFILLKNHRANRDITREEYGLLLDDMEETLEFEKFNETLVEITSKVFTLIGKVNDHKQSVLSKAKKGKETIPMS